MLNVIKGQMTYGTFTVHNHLNVGKRHISCTNIGIQGCEVLIGQQCTTEVDSTLAFNCQSATESAHPEAVSIKTSKNCICF